jgi:D-methionine transport system ATP-binding protein
MISLDKLTKVFGHGDNATVVLEDLNFSVAEREIFAIVGPSGAGKSTLAQCINLLERPTSGSVIVNGEKLSSLNEEQLRIARRRIGTIFQSDGLFSRRTAAQNVALPLEYLGVTKVEAQRRVAELLERVGLSGRANYYPHELSGGQRQRVGIARALALRPTVLLADEATSGLDPESTASIVSLLKELRDDLGLSILFITHEMDTVLKVADSVARLDRGHIVESGSLVELLRNPASPLGQSLRPAHTATELPTGSTQWQLVYANANVPADWLSTLSIRLGSPISLLGASIETINGAVVGQATIGVNSSADAQVISAACDLGLVAERVSRASSSSDSTSNSTSNSAPLSLLENAA